MRRWLLVATLVAGARPLAPPRIAPPTLGDRLLGKPLRAALIEPFLGAYNKKVGDRGGGITCDDLLCVEVDGIEVDAHELAGEAMQSDSVAVLLKTM